MNWTDKLSLALLLALCCLVPRVQAAPVHWKSASVDYTAEGKDIKEVLRDFASSEGLATRVSPNVSGAVSGNFRLAPLRFLDMLAASFGFVWYYDGRVLDITASSELKSTLVKLDTASTATLRDTLDKMQVSDPRFPIVYDSVQGTALVSGPPRYVDLVASVADRVDANAARRDGSQVHVFPLQHAWAEDRSINVDSQTITLQGVVAVLNGIYHPQGNGAAKASQGAQSHTSGVQRSTPMADVNGSTQGGAPPLPPLPAGMPGGDSAGSFLSGLSGQPSPALAAVMGSGADTPASAGHSAADISALPVIVADQRTNSVIVRDTAERIPQYGPLIQRLDVKPQLIEIEAHIIEIQDDALQQLGVDWTAHNSHVDLQTGTGTLAQNTFNGTLTQNFGTTTLAGGVSAAASPAGLSMAAVLGDAGRYLMTRVSALQQTDVAKVDASPKVVTLDNVEAVMNSKTQFFVQVAGHQSADLYSVSTGISLRVLPMVIQEDGHTRIKLDVAIEDGALEADTMVDNLPVIQSSNINTQAFIDEGQALLIAGYHNDNDATSVTGVPGLSKLPLIGALFRSHNRTKNHMETLFLLSPRVIAP